MLLFIMPESLKHQASELLMQPGIFAQPAEYPAQSRSGTGAKKDFICH